MALSLFPGEARSFEPRTLPTQQVFPPYEPLPLPEYLPEAPDEHLTLPPVTPHITPTPPVGPSFILTDIVLQGNTVFSDAELKEVARPFLGTSVTLADLEEIRYRLTLFYVDRGYVNSGALIEPGQQVTDGSVAYLIVEGTLDDMVITGNGRLRAAYIRDRMWPDPKTPFNTERLQEFFQMLLQDPLIERMDGRILPGPKPGTAVLELDVTRAAPYEARIGAHNHSSPNLGAETATFDGTLRNLTGWGDALGISLGYSEGMKELEAGFNIPITSRDTSLFARYNISESKVIDSSLKPLDIRSEFYSIEVGFLHPLYRTPNRTFSLGASLKQGESRTYIFKDMPFSFSDGAVDGKSRTTVLRLVQSYQDRTMDRVLAFRSTFSIGLDLFNPTLHSTSLPDGEFFAWLGQVQYGRRLGPKAGQVIFSGDLQLAANRLLTMEQFSIGGAGSVRGYRKNTHIGDNGCRLSLEWRVPVWEGQRTGAHQPPLLQVVPFLDYGTTWDKKHPQRKGTAGDNNLVSLGTGLMWSSRWLDAELFYGHALKSVDRKEDYNLQDDGILFKVTARFP